MDSPFTNEVQSEIGLALVTRIGMLKAKVDESPTPEYWQRKLDRAEKAFSVWNRVINGVTV
jgi:hypothetical protein